MGNQPVGTGRALRATLQEKREEVGIKPQFSQGFFSCAHRGCIELAPRRTPGEVEATLLDTLLQRLLKNLTRWCQVSVAIFLNKPRPTHRSSIAYLETHRNKPTAGF